MLDLVAEDQLNFILLVVVVLLACAAGYYFLRRPPPPKPSVIKPAPQPLKPQANRRKKESIPAEANGKVIKIFFGSQTGTADDFAHTLAKEAKRYGLYAEVIDLELYDHQNDLQNETTVIFVMSTHGEGEPTDNAKEFYNWLIDKEGVLQDDLLSKLHFTVFGLGNKTYEHYNAVGRLVDKRLQQLGGKRIFEKGEGDDDCSLEEDFNKWKKKLWPTMCKHFGMEATGSSEDEKFVARFRVVQCEPDGCRKNTRGWSKPKTKSDGTPIYDIKNPYLARVLVNRELHGPGSGRSCRHIELDIGQYLVYQPGDHLGIYPENDAALVSQLGQRLRIDLESTIYLVPIDSKSSDNSDAVLGPCTIRQAFTEAIDITTPPRKAVLRALADFASDPSERQKLINLSSDQGSDEYNKIIKNDQRTICEVLEAFPSVNPPLDLILEMLPRLAPRYYSISSSHNAHPGKVHITSVVVQYTTATGRVHQGVCSSWLARLTPGSYIPAFVRESHFHLPLSPAPLVMVGPGTGLAPFRGFMHEIAHRRSNLGSKDWTLALFFGCRNRSHDFIYEEELLHFAREGVISHLHLAFSREQANKIYVQNQMLENKETLWKLLKEQRGYFYVCGDAHLMAKAVQQALHAIARECGKLTDQEATAFVEELQKSGRYLQDVWF